MAITKTLSNRFKLELGKGAVDFTTQTFKAILMNDSFVFNKDTHGTLADVIANQIENNGGYAAVTAVVQTAWNQDNVNDLAFIDWQNITWTAVGADINGFIGAIIYDDTHADDLVVGYIDFDQVVYLSDTTSFQMRNTGFEIKQAV